MWFFFVAKIHNTTLQAVVTCGADTQSPLWDTALRVWRCRLWAMSRHNHVCHHWWQVLSEVLHGCGQTESIPSRMVYVPSSIGASCTA